MDQTFVNQIRHQFEEKLKRMGEDIKVNNGPVVKGIIDYKKASIDFDDLILTTAADVTRGDVISYENKDYIVISEVNTKRYGVYYEVILRRLSLTITAYLEEITKVGTNPPTYALRGKFYIPCCISTTSTDENGKYMFGISKIVVITGEDPRIINPTQYFDSIKSADSIGFSWFFEAMEKEWTVTVTDTSKPGLRLIHSTQNTVESYSRATKDAQPVLTI